MKESSQQEVPFFKREEWTAGEWDNEPNRIEWRSHGMPCLMLRNTFGAWCGYVGVPPNHPWHGINYDKVLVEVHGGLTYSNKCVGNICHPLEEGESDEVWWLGFDCCHYYDLSPYQTTYHNQIVSNFYEETYKNIDYVKKEVESLAQQLAQAKND